MIVDTTPPVLGITLTPSVLLPLNDEEEMVDVGQM